MTIRRGTESPAVVASQRPHSAAPPIVRADTAPCADCLAEFRDSTDRRYRYPFISCRDCGPAWSILESFPWRREGTSMGAFSMCATCKRESGDQRSRRFGTPTMACHDCGPSLRVTDAAGEELTCGSEESIELVIATLRQGAIVAIKGTGGFQLVCDASSPEAVSRLRARSNRAHAPLALLCADLLTVHTLVSVGVAEPLLTSVDRPIVLLPKRRQPGRQGGEQLGLAQRVAPDRDALGVMLPATPLHHLLFDEPLLHGDEAPRVLAFTSGNPSGEPLCTDDDEARARLGMIADVFLTHDLEIRNSVQDSLVAWHPDCGAIVRRSGRGRLPLTMPAPHLSESIAAFGPDGSLALIGQGQATLVPQLRPGLLDDEPGSALRTALVAGTPTQAPVPAEAAVVPHRWAHAAALALEHGRLSPQADPLLVLVIDGAPGCDESEGELAELVWVCPTGLESLAVVDASAADAVASALRIARSRNVTEIGLSGGAATDVELVVAVSARLAAAGLRAVTHEASVAGAASLALGAGIAVTLL